IPSSEWNGARVELVAHSARPFQPPFGSSMRPSAHLAKKPIGYGTRNVTNLPFTSAKYASLVLPVANGTFSPRPKILNQSTHTYELASALPSSSTFLNCGPGRRYSVQPSGHCRPLTASGPFKGPLHLRRSKLPRWPLA